MLTIEISPDQETKLHSILDKGFEIFNLKKELYESPRIPASPSNSQSISESVFKSELEKLQEKIESLEDRLKPIKSAGNTPRFKKTLKRPMSINDDFDFPYKKTRKFKAKKPTLRELKEELNSQISKNEKIRKSNRQLKSEFINTKTLKSKLHSLQEDLSLLTQSYERSETIRLKQKETIHTIKYQLSTIKKPEEPTPQLKHKTGKIHKSSPYQ